MVLKAAVEHSGYNEFDRARFIDEPAKRLGRTEFARDRARIIHSFAQGKLCFSFYSDITYSRIKLLRNSFSFCFVECFLFFRYLLFSRHCEFNIVKSNYLETHFRFYLLNVSFLFLPYFPVSK